MSLPTRERELKLRFDVDVVLVAQSLPTRERELKLEARLEAPQSVLSLPTRERELKPAGGWAGAWR